jgi:hypothetical protein
MQKKAKQQEPQIPLTDSKGNQAGSIDLQAKIYEIHVRGQLDEKWADFFDGMQVKSLDNGEMILFGPITDQAALMGVLNKLGRLNLALLSIWEVKTNT